MSASELAYGGWDTEFDTVIGRVGGKCLLTFVLLPSTILLARLMDKKTQGCVCDEFDYLERVLKENRERSGFGRGDIWWFFPSALTDRGSEMLDFKRLERSLFAFETPGGEWVTDRCRVHYCDAYSSWQKPHIEQAHTLLRRVLPKRTSFDGLTQADVDLVCSHVNSYSRKELGGATPFQAAPPGFTDKLMRALGLAEIDPDEVNLTPRLLDR